MKKVLFILVAVLLCGTVANSQNISDTLFNDYFLPDYIDIENCGSTIYRDSSTSSVALKRGHYYFGRTGWLYTTTTSEGILDRAQPCYTDTLLTIQGVAVGVNLTMNILEEYILSEQYMTPQAKIKLISSWEAYFNFATASNTPAFSS